MKKPSHPEILKFNQNNNELPLIKIKKIINVGKNGFYSFKKIDYNYNFKNKKITKEIEKINNNQIIQNSKKTLLHRNSCNLYNINKQIFDKLDSVKIINNPLIITHINKVKINKKNNKITKNINKYRRQFSSKSVQKEDTNKSIYDNINKKNIHYNMTVYKKNEGTQINDFNYNKNNNLFLSEKKRSSMKIDYCSPKSIIFQKNKIISNYDV